jgi:hypothetical protein
MGQAEITLSAPEEALATEISLQKVRYRTRAASGNSSGVLDVPLGAVKELPHHLEMAADRVSAPGFVAIKRVGQRSAAVFDFILLLPFQEITQTVLMFFDVLIHRLLNRTLVQDGHRYPSEPALRFS